MTKYGDTREWFDEVSFGSIAWSVAIILLIVLARISLFSGTSPDCRYVQHGYASYGDQQLYARLSEGSIHQNRSCSGKIFFRYTSNDRGYAGVVIKGDRGFSGIRAINNGSTTGFVLLSSDPHGITVLPPYVGARHRAISISHGKIVPVSGKGHAKSGSVANASPYSVYLFDPKGVALTKTLLAAIKLAHYTQYRQPDFYAGLSDGRFRQSHMKDGILFFSYVLDHRGYAGFLAFRATRYLQDRDVKKIAPGYLEINVHQPDSGPSFNALRLSHGLITPATGGLPTSREVVSNHEIGEIYLFNPKGVALPGNGSPR